MSGLTFIALEMDVLGVSSDIHFFISLTLPETRPLLIIEMLSETTEGFKAGSMFSGTCLLIIYKLKSVMLPHLGITVQCFLVKINGCL